MSSIRPVVPDRTGWRCQDISERHRVWGFNCPAVDLDFVMIEYNKAVPVALVEYKHCMARPPNLQHPTYRTLARLADKYSDGALPFMLVFYCPDEWWFQVQPVNDRAREFCVNGNPISEQQYVRGLYHLRRQALTAADAAAIAQLSAVQPLGLFA